MQFLIILFALAVAVWMVPLIRSQRPIALPTLVLVAGVVFGPPFFAIDGPFQISLDRVLWCAMLVHLLVHLRLGNLKLPPLTRIDGVVAITTVWLLVSCLRGGPVPDGSSPLARWLFYVALPVGMYVSFRIVPIESRDFRWFSRVLLGMGSYLSVMALFEVAGWHGLVFPRHIVDPESWEFFGRGRGPLLNPAGNGILIATALVVAANEFFQATGRSKLLFLVLGVVAVTGLYATLTRSVWLGAAGALAMVGWVYLPRWARVLGLAASVLCAGGLALGAKEQLLQLKRDKHLTAADAAKSVELRPLLAIVAWEMIKDRPIVGHGFGHYFEHAGPYHENRTYDLPLEQARPYIQHNVLLSLAIDSGLIGLFLVVVGGTIVFCFAWKLGSSGPSHPLSQSMGVLALGGSAAYVINGMFQDVSVIPMMNMVWLSIMGMTVNLHAAVRHPADRRCSPGPVRNHERTHPLSQPVAAPLPR